MVTGFQPGSLRLAAGPHGSGIVGVRFRVTVCVTGPSNLIHGLRVPATQVTMKAVFESQSIS